MNLVIEVKEIVALLLPGDEHFRNVEEGSFSLGECQFTGFGEGNDHRTKESTWANWNEEKKGERYACPLGSILAVRYKDRSQ